MTTDVATSSTVEPPFDLADGRDELNLIDLPLTLPEAKRRQLGKDGVRTHTLITPEVWDNNLQQHVVRSVEIIPSPDLGFPGTFDNRVLLVCTSLSRWMNRDDEGKQIDGFLRQVPFSIKKMLDLLRLPPSGQSYKRLRESLERWQSTDYRISYPWYDKRKKKRRAVHRFNLLDNIVWDADDSPEESLFTLNEMLFQSLDSKYVRKFDLDKHARFKSHHAGEAYRLLEKLFFQDTAQELPLDEFAFHVAAGECSDNGQLKRKLQPAIKELEDEGIIVPLPKKDRYIKHGRSSWSIRFEQPAPNQLVDLKPLDAKQKELFDTPAVEELTRRGVKPIAAKKIADKYDEEEIALKIEWAEWLQQEDPKKVKSLPAVIVAAITQGWEPGPEFKTKAQRELEATRAKEAEANRRRKQDQEAAQKAEEADKRSRQYQARQDRVNAFLDALSPEERESLIQQALVWDSVSGLNKAGKYHTGKDQGWLAEQSYNAAVRHIAEQRMAEADA